MQRLHKVVASCYVIIIFDFGKIARRVWGSDCIMNSTALATTIELSSMVLYSNKLINWPIGIGVGSLSKYIHHGILSTCSYICTCTVTCNSQVFPWSTYHWNDVDWRSWQFIIINAWPKNVYGWMNHKNDWIL